MKSNDLISTIAILESAGVKPASPSISPAKSRQNNLNRVGYQLKNHGYRIAITEKVVRKRQGKFFLTEDAFGCIDLMAIHEKHSGVLGVMITADTLKTSLEKIKNLTDLPIWLTGRNRFVIALMTKDRPFQMFQITSQTLKSGGVIEFKL
jgi:hypothetical protein